MSPKHRPAEDLALRRDNRPEQRGHEGADKGETDDETAATPTKPPTDLQRAKAAVAARWMGRKPVREDLAGCERGAGPDDPRCILGRFGGERCQGPQKAPNIILISRSGRGDDGYIAAAAAIQRELGTWLNEVNGGDSGTYLGEVAECYLLAQRELNRSGRHIEALDCAHAYRSQIALLALAAVPQARLRDRVIYGDGEQLFEGQKIDHRLPGVAVCGPRNSVKAAKRQRGSGLSTENAAASMLARELGTVDDLGLVRAEIEVVKDAIAGDVGAAREVASWCYGTVPGWWIRIRRVETSEGPAAEMVYGVGGEEARTGEGEGLGSNPYKPSFAAAQMRATGELTRMSPARSDVVNDKWGAGEFHTEISDGTIRSRCGTGEAEVPELPGAVVWQVDIAGASVRFSA